MVQLFPGGPGGLSTTPIAIPVPSQTSGYIRYFGVDMSAARDVNGDGFDDLLVNDGKPGACADAFLFLGGPSGIPTAPSTVMTGVGTAVGVGEVTGNGYGDFALGCWTWTLELTGPAGWTGFGGTLMGASAIY